MTLSALPEELPVAVKVLRPLARWIWTLYRDHPGLAEYELVRLTGTAQASVNRSVQVLVKAGLLKGVGRARQAVATPQPGRQARPSARSPGRARAQKRVYQTRTLAAQQASALSAGDAHYRVFVVRVPGAATGSGGNRAAGTAYVVALDQDEVAGLIAAGSKYAALYDFSSKDPEKRPQIRDF